MTEDKAYLLHMLEAIERTVAYVDEASAEFLDDPKTQDAVIRNLTVIGEAVKNLSQGLREAHPHVPWKKIAGMRDNLVHGYFGIDLQLVYDTVRVHLPELRRNVETILRES